jgi:hypothetical protein
MNVKQRKIKLQQRQRPQIGPIEESEKVVFGYTVIFHIIKTIKRITGVLVYLYIMGISTNIMPTRWYFNVLWGIIFILCIIGMFKYGEFGRIYKNDIYIERNRIYYHYIIQMRYTTSGEYLMIDAIKRVKVKWNKIVIWGDIINMYTGKLIPQKKKLVFPKSIKNVDEFIHFAKSQVVAE